MTNIERFEERLRNEDAMKDTEPIASIDSLIQENALLRRSLSVLNKRIEELEGEIYTMRSEYIQTMPDMDRIAETLRTFYFAEHSLSSLQPLIALTLKLNPNIIEQ